MRTRTGNTTIFSFNSYKATIRFRALVVVWLVSILQPIAWAEESLPNIVLINVDDLGWKDLSCQESSYYRTPNIDRLAEQGMRFSQAYASASNCAPSRACMLTGQYGPRHGVYTVNNSDRGQAKLRKLIPTKNTLAITEQNLTIADLLQQAGYRSISIGKWHVSTDPLQHGFDLNVAGSTYGHPVKEAGGYHSPYRYPNCVADQKGEYLTDRLTDEAIQFVDDNKEKPFFLYLPFYTVHSPLQARPDKQEKWDTVKGHPGQSNAAYAAMVESLDDNVGRILARLDALELTDKTVVVFTSDNGGVWKTSRQTPLRAGKGSYFEGGIRVPMIVRWPGRVKAGVTSDEPVINVDFMPTFAEIAGATIPEDKPVDGVSLLPIFDDADAQLAQRNLYWHFPIYLQGNGGSGEFATHDADFRTRPGSVIRSGNWKLHEYFEDRRLELYDLDSDVSETTNLALKKPEITQRLHQQLKDWREETNAPVPTDLNPRYKPAR